MRRPTPAVLAVVVCALAGAAACVLPALGAAGPGVPWPELGLLALLYAACELTWGLVVTGRGGRRDGAGLGSFFPVLLAAAFLLPPAAAALVAVPGALLGRLHEGADPRWLRRVWHAAQLALATCAAARTWEAMGQHPLTEPRFPHLLLPALAAAAAFCTVLTLLDAAVLGVAERRPLTSAGPGLVYALVPHMVHGLAGLMMAVLWRSPYGPVSALLVLLPMFISCWVFAQYHRERAAHQATIRALVQAVDIKDRYTRGHSERVGRASALIGRELGMPDERQEVLRFAGILHDVGKLGVPTRVLRKDGPLTEDERRVIQLHPEYGHEIVRGIGFLQEARAAILHHHERLDGGGYPYGLKGEEIPEYARVVAVADAFDAMTSTRSYRRAREVPAALAELRRCAGAQFDPRMVAALVRAIERQGWHVSVTSDEVGGVPVAGAAAGGASGAVPGGGVPSGAVPGGATPSGAVPSGVVPSGPVPSGAVSSGAAPSSAVPSGAVPNPAHPPDQAPPASAPAPGDPQTPATPQPARDHS
ncbi:HD domain-containing phosphohydrolase [Streptomyces boninensis]|uniref:HD-GYP domain-containing protein n=1 Tax=Streptomyces boninensis TaxID=2039455 RepID=UPI003B220AA4